MLFTILIKKGKIPPNLTIEQNIHKEIEVNRNGSARK